MNQDATATAAWNDSYNIKAATLWGEPAVPFATQWQKYLAIDGPLLDMPCGDGRNTLALQAGDRPILGADTSLNGLRIARSRLDRKTGGTAVPLLQQDVFATQFVDDTFASVFCWDLLGHLRLPASPIDELLRIVRPGGVIVGSIFSTGDSTRGQDMQCIGNEEYIFANRFYFKFYARDEVQQLLRGRSADLLALELTSWMEPPHEGYREYEHRHESWAFVLRKRQP